MGPTARHFVLSILLVATLAPAFSLADEADDQYAVAAGHYARKRWELAVEEFREYLQKHADHKRADDATFFMAESRVRRMSTFSISVRCSRGTASSWR
ncbi:MAG: hypothetical protein IH897_01575 [Planctomycetes bacterium]|nr:hypothetical protein [Planctomycetota bacterium]